MSPSSKHSTSTASTKAMKRHNPFARSSAGSVPSAAALLLSAGWEGSSLLEAPHAPSAASSASASNSSKPVTRTTPSFRIMSLQNIIALLTVLVCGLATVNGLKCYMCGQYNEGVGSITPCLNYSDQYAHLYLKECSKKSEKYCVKYVSELSTVRDCATECAEKEIWETQTYCCNEDGCNGASSMHASLLVLAIPFFAYVCSAICALMKGRR